MRVKDIPGFEGLYVITDDGRLIRLYRQWPDRIGRLTMRESQVMVCAPDKAGYAIAHLHDPANDIHKSVKLHRLVAAAFCPPHDGECVNHIDGDRSNNHWTNLEWCDTESNLQHGQLRKRHIRLTARQIMEIKQLTGQLPIKAICNRYNVDRATVQRLVWGAKRKPRNV